MLYSGLADWVEYQSSEPQPISRRTRKKRDDIKDSTLAAVTAGQSIMKTAVIKDKDGKNKMYANCPLVGASSPVPQHPHDF